MADKRVVWTIYTDTKYEIYVMKVLSKGGVDGGGAAERSYTASALGITHQGLFRGSATPLIELAYLAWIP